MRFHDKVALITAAASGIGRATADIIAQEGGIVVAVDNHEERLDRTVAQLNEAGGRAHRRLCNALDEKDVQATVGSIVREFGRIDILVNAVGGSTIIGKSGATVDELSFSRLAEADRLQPLGHVPLHPCRRAGHESADQRQDRQPVVDRRARPQRLVEQRLRRREGRHHRLYQEARLRARPLRHQHQCDRAEPHADRAHPAALGPVEPGGPAGRDRAHAAAPRRRGGGPGQGDLLPGIQRCRFRDRRDHRRNRRKLTMATFVLVHGSYQGGWIWQPVANRLRAAGHQVYAPSLDGCGERKGQMRPGITTETQADEVAQLLFYEDLKDVVLVGTSYGGMVACRAAELMRERIGRLVFVDALALFDGEKVADILPRTTSVADGRHAPAEPRGRREPPVRRPRPQDPRLGARTLHAASDCVPLPTGQARSFWSQPWKASVIWCRQRSEPGRGTPAPRRRTARRQMGRARHRPLPDAEHADRTDRAIDGGMRRASRDEHRSDRPADRGVLLCRARTFIRAKSRMCCSPIPRWRTSQWSACPMPNGARSSRPSSRRGPAWLPDGAALEAFCRRHLASHKVPRLWRFVSQFPQTASGKLQKFMLREQELQAERPWL